jgi:glyoxylase-like metal-dependent hydrolase (beta-lactamase superfamily II)
MIGLLRRGPELLAEPWDACQMLSPPPTHPDHGLAVVPLLSPTLPPAQHTNMVWVGRERRWIVDPAAHTPEEQKRALEILAEHRGDLGWEGVLLTHHHRDHVAAANVISDGLGIPIAAHPITADLLAGKIKVDRTLEEGDVVVGSDAPDDQWRVLHTPGHASGHIVLWEPTRGWLVAGDMIAAVGTIIIEPPDGHMTTYLEQLQRLVDLHPRRLVPAHGEVVEDPVTRLRAYIAHRLERESKVRLALSKGPADLPELTRRSYPELDPVLLPLAECSCLAHLIRLEEEGEAHGSGVVWSVAGEA